MFESLTYFALPLLWALVFFLSFLIARCKSNTTKKSTIKNPTTAAARTPLDKLLLFVCLSPPGSDLSAKYTQNSHFRGFMGLQECCYSHRSEFGIKSQSFPILPLASVSKWVLVKRSLIYIKNTSVDQRNFHKNGFVRRLVLIQAKGNLETAYWVEVRVVIMILKYLSALIAGLCCLC